MHTTKKYIHLSCTKCFVQDKLKKYEKSFSIEYKPACSSFLFKKKVNHKIYHIWYKIDEKINCIMNQFMWDEK